MDLCDKAGPGNLNPYVVELLKEDGIDITGKKTNDVFDFFKEGRQYDYVITVCSKEAEARCPIFPGRVVRRNRGLDDPSAAITFRPNKGRRHGRRH